MLNIFAYRLKDSKPTTLKYKGNDVGHTRHYPPANKEWLNSIYAYNKNTTSLIPIADKVIIKLIKSYFNLFSRKLERKIRSPRLNIRKRRLSTKRIMLSRAELKHNTDKVTITLYIYNRQKNYYLNKMRKIVNLPLLKLNQFKVKIKAIKRKALMVISIVNKEKDLLLKALKWDNNNFKNYERNYYKLFIKKSLKKETLYMYFRQIVFFNKYKFNNIYLLPLKSLIGKIYNKKVEFNLVTIKYLYLNSDILLHILATKLRNRKNRVLSVLKASMRAVKLPSPKRLLYLRYSKQDELQKLKLKDLLLYSSARARAGEGAGEGEGALINKDCKSETLNYINNMKDFDITKTNQNDIEDFVLSSIKHKSINGIRIEASGRLSRRITAARSVHKFKYLGGLKNIDSSYKGLSCVMLRGHFKSNLQYTKLKSKTRIGSFGLKAFLSSI